MKQKHRRMLYRIIAASVLTVLFALVPAESGAYGKPFKFLLFLVPYLIIGYDILIKAFKGIVRGRALDENVLMAIATIGAMILGAVHTGDFEEAVAVMIFYQIGELFQALAVER
ncbi:MAG: hypothetical protein J5494_02510, partial [Candidatus Methanomethylophilaceae archaeon]|nr:hypothetical protein [Candidatus Methanomethylophilaceae archaeon]